MLPCGVLRLVASGNATKSKPINPAEAPVLAVKKRAYWSSMRGPSLEREPKLPRESHISSERTQPWPRRGSTAPPTVA
jgi:hypothetical protein